MSPGTPPTAAFPHARAHAFVGVDRPFSHGGEANGAGQELRRHRRENAALPVAHGVEQPPQLRDLAGRSAPPPPHSGNFARPSPAGTSSVSTLATLRGARPFRLRSLAIEEGDTAHILDMSEYNSALQLVPAVAKVAVGRPWQHCEGLRTATLAPCCPVLPCPVICCIRGFTPVTLLGHYCTTDYFCCAIPCCMCLLGRAPPDGGTTLLYYYCDACLGGELDWGP